jgi:hypothetical protein
VIKPVEFYDPKGWLAELVDQLLNVPGPARMIDLLKRGRKNAGGIGAKEADDINMAAGKEDLATYSPILLDVIDAIPDADERFRTYEALYHVVNATYRIARSIDPLSALQRSEEKQAAQMRAAYDKKFADNRAGRNKIVLSVIEKNKSSKFPSSAGRLLDRVNKELVDKEYGKITERTFYRIIRGRKKN